MTALSAPVPLAPAAGAFALHNAPAEFAWSEVIGASTYTLEIGDSAAFAPPLAVSRVLLGSRASVSPLPAGTLFWRVRVNDERGAPGEWSQPRALRVIVSSVPESLPPPRFPARARPR